ncbi:catechol 2,3-dioxygenase [Evansella caseinilytica]|uniref:Catechol 2,3-dioxygenase n=1 Tax=Evansella caseinilytica TaxID=1503961 RepID=A0A1H3QE61_9BACI|nr:VOC family protein [Evansella caseinilytica]SDZ11009.1 catechol 2,3-dioxygenase [Evansella caseinilytica]
MDQHAEIQQVELIVADLKRAKQFYEKCLGFSVLDEQDNAACLGVEDQAPILILRENKDVLPKRPEATGLYHFAILLPSRSDLGSWLAHISTQNYSLTGGSDHRFSEAIYLNDPDGIGIEVYADRSTETWETEDNLLRNVGNAPLDVDGLLEEGAGRRWSGLPAGTKIGHIHLHVNDLAKASAYYETILGFQRKIMIPDSLLFIAAGTYHHHIGFNTWGGVDKRMVSRMAAGMTGYTVRVTDEEQLSALLDKLKAAGIPIEYINDKYTVTDPFGFALFFVSGPRNTPDFLNGIPKSEQ